MLFHPKSNVALVSLLKPCIIVILYIMLFDIKGMSHLSLYLHFMSALYFILHYLALEVMLSVLTVYVSTIMYIMLFDGRSHIMLT